VWNPTIEFIWRPLFPILSPSSRTFSELTLVRGRLSFSSILLGFLVSFYGFFYWFFLGFSLLPSILWFCSRLFELFSNTKIIQIQLFQIEFSSKKKISKIEFCLNLKSIQTQNLFKFKFCTNSLFFIFEFFFIFQFRSNLKFVQTQNLFEFEICLYLKFCSNIKFVQVWKNQNWKLFKFFKRKTEKYMKKCY
jgi:hypothetical protein